jgi:hypothetical protein
LRPPNALHHAHFINHGQMWLFCHGLSF